MMSQFMWAVSLNFRSCDADGHNNIPINANLCDGLRPTVSRVDLAPRTVTVGTNDPHEPEWKKQFEMMDGCVFI